MWGGKDRFGNGRISRRKGGFFDRFWPAKIFFSKYVICFIFFWGVEANSSTTPILERTTSFPSLQACFNELRYFEEWKGPPVIGSRRYRLFLTTTTVRYKYILIEEMSCPNRDLITIPPDSVLWTDKISASPSPPHHLNLQEWSQSVSRPTYIYSWFFFKAAWSPFSCILRLYLSNRKGTLFNK